MYGELKKSMIERGEPIKIAFIGTSCIGKTTLLNHFRTTDLGLRVTIVDEAARDFFQENDVPDRFSAETQKRVQALALTREREAHANLPPPDIILCDRSVIDAVAYVKATGDEKGALQLLSDVQFWLSTYTHFLLLDPADIPYEQDEIRQEDPETRMRFHQAFLDFFAETEIPCELLSGTVEERVARIETILSAAP